MQRPELISTPQYIAWYARDTPESTAVVEDRSHITYRTLAADLVRRVWTLESRGVRPGMIAGVLTRQRYQHLLLLLACELTGATATSLTPDLSDDDPIGRHCDVVLTDDAATASNRSNTIVVSPDSPDHYLPVNGSRLDALDRAVAPDGIARIIRTSGTTGQPKAMPMSHATQQLRIVRSMDRVARDVLPNPRFLCLYGLGVGAIQVRVLSILQHGGTVLFAKGEHACALLALGVVNYAMVAVGDVDRLVQDAVRPPAGHVPHIVIFGAAVAPRLRRELRERLNANISNPYSSNETNPISIVGDNNMGTLCEGVEVRIVDDAGRCLPPGEAGLIRVRSDTMLHGYFDDPVAAGTAFVDGWYQTSDIGFVPEPGKLVVLGRADGMLNIGGVKIAPWLIEARINDTGCVDDAVVVSVAGPHDVGILLAAVEIGDARVREASMQRVGAIFSEFVTRFTIMPVRRLPRTVTGKVRRGEIEAMFHRTPARDLIVVNQ